MARLPHRNFRHGMEQRIPTQEDGDRADRHMLLLIKDRHRSKVRTRELCAELGLPSPRARRVRSLDELYAAAGYVGFPAVVKPEFGRSAFGIVRVDDLESLPTIYTLVRSIARPETHAIFRVGNDLLLEEYLDGVEFDVDLVMHDGSCVFSSVSQNWPTAEPSFRRPACIARPTTTSARCAGWSTW